MTTHRINLRPDADDRRDSYGVLLVSEQVHRVTGRGVHNPHHNHEIQVWENRPSKARGADPDVKVTPYGDPTEEDYTFTTSAQATVISAHRLGNERTEGDTLAIGDVLELAVNGYVLGRFVLTAKSLHDPILVPEALA